MTENLLLSPRRNFGAGAGSLISQERKSGPLEAAATLRAAVFAHSQGVKSAFTPRFTLNSASHPWRRFLPTTHLCSPPERSPIATTRGARRLSTSNIVAAAKATNGKEAEIRFSDGSAFAFHALWLRDSCRDAAHVEGEGERVLTASPLVSRLPLDIGIKDINLEANGSKLSVAWDLGAVEKSTFDAGLLRALAPFAGKELSEASAASASPGRAVDYGWFEFLNGRATRRARRSRSGTPRRR